MHVARGKLMKTGSGLTRSDVAIVPTRGGGNKFVSAKRRARSQKHPWILAVTAARKQLGVTGFVPVKKGTELYSVARSLYEQSK